MTREKTIAETAQDARKPSAPAPAPRKNRLLLILGIIFLLLLIAAGVFGGLIFFGVISFAEPTASPTATPFNVLDPLAEFDDCAPLIAARSDLYCNLVELETDSTWTNSLLTAQELIDADEMMGISETANPGAYWISPVSLDRPIEKVFYLPEGQVDFAEVRITISATFPLASITINGERFEEGRNFAYGEDELFSPMGLIFLKPLPEGSTPAFRRVNLRQFLTVGRNLIQFQFASADALASPEATINPEATLDPDASPVPSPSYALLAQIKIPVTGVFNTVQHEVYLSDADWQDAPNVGFLPNANPDEVMGDAQWIQGIDRPLEGEETVTVERVFYLDATAPNYALTLDIRNGTLSSISIVDSAGNEKPLLLPPSGGTTETENGFSFQRYAAIPLSSGFSVGLNRLVIAYAPNSDVGHYIRLRMNNSARETILVSDATWMRGAYRTEAETSADSISLSAAVQRGTAHLRGYLALPTSNISGNVLITCLQERGEIPCSTIQLRHENEIYSFGTGEIPSTITLVQPERLFGLDLTFQSDTELQELATVRLGIVYVDATGASQALGAGVWYGYQGVGVLSSINSAWAVVEDAAFIDSAYDDEAGEYISVFETTLPLPTNAVVIEAQAVGSVDDHLLAIYINDALAYQGNGSSEDFRQVTTFPIDGALLRAGENRIVVYQLNTVGDKALAMRLDLRYFSQVSP